MDFIEDWDFLDYSFIDENTSPDILLPNYNLNLDNNYCSSSGREIVVHQEKKFVDRDCSRARGDAVDHAAGQGLKLCREKLRREKLNERFLDLSSILEPGRPARTDKSAILDDAIRVLTQLRTDAQELKETNEKLLEEIKSLKAEKNEIREEKLVLKANKERIEQQLKTLNVSPARYLPAHQQGIMPRQTRWQFFLVMVWSQCGNIYLHQHGIRLKIMSLGPLQRSFFLHFEFEHPRMVLALADLVFRVAASNEFNANPTCYRLSQLVIVSGLWL
ncbi:hypothetical protein CXB51_025748 [Gossypium anomalum]|uniref:BHLH domain-containing protein n=1 Tax=Gossypium anomalum TaxID=47600 RepID=A0A8J6CN31_9ROSI|nr:hypothetical protein CXB51_025748 [Gossypium anomalum]